MGRITIKKVIGISGKAESGKTTASSILKTELEKLNKKVCLINYGDLVKFIAVKYYNWNGVKDCYGRALLQKIGTEIGRNKVDPSIWVKFVINIAKILYYDYDIIIIGDCRFPNEYKEWDSIENFEIVKLRIERPNHSNKLTDEQRQHISETALDDYSFDYTIVNDSDLEKLTNKIQQFVKTILTFDFK